jgi:hypothetical protein
MPKICCDVYLDLRDKISFLADKLIALPECDVWIHEKALFKILRLPRGDHYGFRDCLSAIIQGIEQEFWGSKRSILIGCNTQSVHLQLKAAGIEYHTNGMDVQKSLMGDGLMIRQ